MRLTCSFAAVGLAAGALTAAAQPARPPIVAGSATARVRPGAYQGRAEQTERFSRKIKMGRDGRFSVTNIAGDIVVTGGSGDEVEIEAVKRTRGDQRELAAVEIEVDAGANRVDVRTVHTTRRDRVSVEYTITVPRSARVDMRSVSGNLKAAGVQGALRAETISGNVVTSATPGLELARSVSGNVEVTDVAASGDVKVASVSGNLRLKAVKARGLDFNTISGDVTLADVACDRLGARSVSGNIEYSGALAKNGRYDVNSHSGNVRLTLAEAIGFELTGNTFSGSIHSELPLTIGSDTNAGRGRRRVLSNRSMRATSSRNGDPLQNCRIAELQNCRIAGRN